MKKTKKILLTVLSTLAIATASFGMASCDILGGISSNSSTQGETNEIRQVYALYVAHAEEQGQIPLSYEMWLMSIRGEKGEQGEVGPQGPQGEQGEVGPQGVGIEKVEYDKDGNLLITFTDGSTQTVVMPEKEEHVHTFGNWTAFTDSVTPCEERLFFRVCSTCNEVAWKQGTYDDHAWDSVTTAPTCQAQGYDTKTCTVCGKVEVGNYTAIIDHAWANEYSFDNSYHWIDCDTCDDVKENAEHTPDETGECSVCHELVGATEGVLYNISLDGTYAEVIGYEGTATKIRIADTHEGLPVKAIYKQAFYQNSKITSVIIPHSVETIGYSAFRGCSNLTSVEIGDSVTTIGNYAFYYCTELTSVEIGDNVETIGNYAFYYCTELTSVEIGDSVTTIGNTAFAECTSLTSVVIPDSVETIGEYAFRNCTNLTSVVIGDSVKTIGEYAFSDCSNLMFVEYEKCQYLGNENNPYLVLIQVRSNQYSPNSIHEDTKVIAEKAFYGCVGMTSIAIPDSVTTIGNYAFEGCTNLTDVYYQGTVSDWCKVVGVSGIISRGITVYIDGELVVSVVTPEDITAIQNYAFYKASTLETLVISDNVEKIGDYAFDYCSSLKTVVIGSGVNYIGNMAFNYCTDLTSVYYKGTVEDWAKISIVKETYIGGGSNVTSNSSLTNATRYYYSETKPTESGNYWHYDKNGEVAVW